MMHVQLLTPRRQTPRAYAPSKTAVCMVDHTAANNSSRGWYGIDLSAELRLGQSLQFLVGNSEDGTPSQPQASYQRNTGRPPSGRLLMCKSRCLWMTAGV